MAHTGVRFTGEGKLDFIRELRKSVTDYFEKREQLVCAFVCWNKKEKIDNTVIAIILCIKY